MSTIFANSVLNIIQQFSPEDLEAFSHEFLKLQIPVVKSKQIKVKHKDPMVTLEYAVKTIKDRDRIPKQV
ncbi:hypothetical protein DNC80_14260 [Flavobacterium sp. SOK18b]|uniref:hypothetical protein n=1 Tax=Flavobacterium sp. SOK18b TaxID=797900 RepID=UPI0015FC8D5E|nr:hypothetical protein [Flavobacterium sp. SOK18b]MBB1194830.1 hypothetical protein [Flavobacterium sp. SOK18b]